MRCTQPNATAWCAYDRHALTSKSLTASSAALCQVPFVSLDAPWCFDYGLRSGANWAFPLAAEDGTVQDNRFWC